MRPPICRICEKRMEEVNDGGLIYFKKRQSDIEWEKKWKKLEDWATPPMLNGSVKNIMKGQML